MDYEEEFQEYFQSSWLDGLSAIKQDPNDPDDDMYDIVVSFDSFATNNKDDVSIYDVSYEEIQTFLNYCSAG